MRVCGVEGWKERRGEVYSEGVWSRGMEGEEREDVE